MGKDASMDVKNAVHKVQLSLLEGIQDERQLFAAGSLMSQGDYQDVVTERTIANLCGYPLCCNSLPLEQPKKGRYRISLKEHKVYDLHEMYLHCSTRCVVNSRAFAARLPERCLDIKPAKISEILRLFESLSLDSKEDVRNNSDLGLPKLTIKEKADINKGEVSFEEWVGPSDAIEGYIPQREHSSKPRQSTSKREGHNLEYKQAHVAKEDHITFNDMDFTSTIITQDEYTISKSPGSTKSDSSNKRNKSKDLNSKKHHKDMKDLSRKFQKPDISVGSPSGSKSHALDKSNDEVVRIDDLSFSKLSLASDGEDLNVSVTERNEQLRAEKASGSNASLPKSSLKSSDSKKVTRCVTWADERTEENSGRSLCEYKESENEKRTPGKSGTKELEDDENSYRLASAEACVQALSQAAEVVASGESDISAAVAETGLIILPPPQVMNDISKIVDNDNELYPNRVPSKWPSQPGSPNFDLFDSEDSWYDSPPDGFSLALSPFATMFMALFAWISSSSLAYIYGRDESCHEEYLSVNGREYPSKVVAIDGRSSEIKQTLAGCLARALPGLVTDLRLPTPVSTLEQGMARLIDTMTFIDPVPSFRMKQWQVIVLLFLDALSVSRIPALTPYVTSRRVLLPKVLDGALISAEEYETMKDLIIPLGRVPQFSSQSGG